MLKIIIHFLLCFYCCRVNQIASKKTGPSGRRDTVCVSRLNLTNLNEKMVNCRGAPLDPVPGNLAKEVENRCSAMKQTKKCYEAGITELSECLIQEEKNTFKMYVKMYDAAINFRCKRSKKLYQRYLSTDGKKCEDQKRTDLETCEETFDLIEPWPTLNNITFSESNKPFTDEICHLKGMWVYCKLLNLDDCSDKTAHDYIRGFYRSMLSVSPCSTIAKKEYPALYEGANSSNAIEMNYFILGVMLIFVYVFNIIS